MSRKQSVPKEWRCFHCDEVFTEHKAAQEHFGHSVLCVPVCQIYSTTIRNMEREIRDYRQEDTALHRQIENLKSEHAQAVRRAEELGYDRGIREAGRLGGSYKNTNF